MDDTLTAHLKLAEYYNVPVPDGLKPDGVPMTVQYPLNVRSGAGIYYPIVGGLRIGETVFVAEVVNGWAKIGDGKWCKEFYLAT